MTPTPFTGLRRATFARWRRQRMPRSAGSHRSTSDPPTRSGGVSETLSQHPSELTQEVEVRRLAYSDLPAVIAIERRSFPAPWSLAMFVLELSKPSGICLAAIGEEEVMGYLVCSRYDRVWHLMNVAVAPEHRRGGVATRLIERLAEESGRELPFTL